MSNTSPSALPSIEQILAEPSFWEKDTSTRDHILNTWEAGKLQEATSLGLMDGGINQQSVEGATALARSKYQNVNDTLGLLTQINEATADAYRHGGAMQDGAELVTKVAGVHHAQSAIRPFTAMVKGTKVNRLRSELDLLADRFESTDQMLEALEFTRVAAQANKMDSLGATGEWWRAFGQVLPRMQRNVDFGHVFASVNALRESPEWYWRDKKTSPLSLEEDADIQDLMFRVMARPEDTPGIWDSTFERFGRKMSPEEREHIDSVLERELNRGRWQQRMTDVLRQDLDPNDDLSGDYEEHVENRTWDPRTWIHGGKVAEMVGETLPYMGTFAIPIAGFGYNYLNFRGENLDRLDRRNIEDGLNLDYQAMENIASSAALVQTSVERLFGFFSIFKGGRGPINRTIGAATEKLVDRFGNKVLAEYAGRIAGGIASRGVGEMVEEVIQDSSPWFFENAYQTVVEDLGIPVAWTKESYMEEMGQFWKQAPEMGVMMLGLGVFGARGDVAQGTADRRTGKELTARVDRENAGVKTEFETLGITDPAPFMSSRDFLVAAGYKPKVADKIVRLNEEGRPMAAGELVRENFSSRKPESETAKEVRARLDEERGKALIQVAEAEQRLLKDAITDTATRQEELSSKLASGEVSTVEQLIAELREGDQASAVLEDGTKVSVEPGKMPEVTNEDGTTTTVDGTTRIKRSEITATEKSMLALSRLSRGVLKLEDLQTFMTNVEAWSSTKLRERRFEKERQIRESKFRQGTETIVPGDKIEVQLNDGSLVEVTSQEQWDAVPADKIRSLRLLESGTRHRDIETQFNILFESLASHAIRKGQNWQDALRDHGYKEDEITWQNAISVLVAGFNSKDSDRSTFKHSIALIDVFMHTDPERTIFTWMHEVLEATLKEDLADGVLPFDVHEMRVHLDELTKDSITGEERARLNRATDIEALAIYSEHTMAGQIKEGAKSITEESLWKKFVDWVQKKWARIQRMFAAAVVISEAIKEEEKVGGGLAVDWRDYIFDALGLKVPEKYEYEATGTRTVYKDWGQGGSYSLQGNGGEFGIRAQEMWDRAAPPSWAYDNRVRELAPNATERRLFESGDFLSIVDESGNLMVVQISQLEERKWSLDVIEEPEVLEHLAAIQQAQQYEDRAKIIWTTHKAVNHRARRATEPVDYWRRLSIYGMPVQIDGQFYVLEHNVDGFDYAVNVGDNPRYSSIDLDRYRDLDSMRLENGEPQEGSEGSYSLRPLLQPEVETQLEEQRQATNQLLEPLFQDGQTERLQEDTEPASVLEYFEAAGDGGADTQGGGQDFSEPLQTWAKESGRIIEFERLQEFLGESDNVGGFEHKVYYLDETGSVLKIADFAQLDVTSGDVDSPLFPINWVQYFRRLEAHNSLLDKRVAVQVVGVVKMPNGKVYPVITQAFVENGQRTTLEERRNYFAQGDWWQLKANTFFNLDLDWVITDAHELNVLKTPDGDFMPIDLQLDPVDPNYKARYRQQAQQKKDAYEGGTYSLQQSDSKTSIDERGRLTLADGTQIPSGAEMTAANMVNQVIPLLSSSLVDPGARRLFIDEVLREVPTEVLEQAAFLDMDYVSPYTDVDSRRDDLKNAIRLRIEGLQPTVIKATLDAEVERAAAAIGVVSSSQIVAWLNSERGQEDFNEFWAQWTSDKSPNTGRQYLAKESPEFTQNRETYGRMGASRARKAAREKWRQFKKEFIDPYKQEGRTDFEALREGFRRHRQAMVLPAEHVRLAEERGIQFRPWGAPVIPLTLPQDNPLIQGNTPGMEREYVEIDDTLAEIYGVPVGQMRRDEFRQMVAEAIYEDLPPLEKGQRAAVYLFDGGTYLSPYESTIGGEPAPAVTLLDLLNHIPEFKDIKNSGDGRAYALFISEARAIRDLIIQQALEKQSRRFNIQVDLLDQDHVTQAHQALKQSGIDSQVLVLVAPWQVHLSVSQTMLSEGIYTDLTHEVARTHQLYQAAVRFDPEQAQVIYVDYDSDTHEGFRDYFAQLTQFPAFPGVFVEVWGATPAVREWADHYRFLSPEVQNAAAIGSLGGSVQETGRLQQGPSSDSDRRGESGLDRARGLITQAQALIQEERERDPEAEEAAELEQQIAETQSLIEVYEKQGESATLADLRVRLHGLKIDLEILRNVVGDTPPFEEIAELERQIAEVEETIAIYERQKSIGTLQDAIDRLREARRMMDRMGRAELMDHPPFREIAKFFQMTLEVFEAMASYSKPETLAQVFTQAVLRGDEEGAVRMLTRLLRDAEEAGVAMEDQAAVEAYILQRLQGPASNGSYSLRPQNADPEYRHWLRETRRQLHDGLIDPRVGIRDFDRISTAMDEVGVPMEFRALLMDYLTHGGPRSSYSLARRVVDTNLFAQDAWEHGEDYPMDSRWRIIPPGSRADQFLEGGDQVLLLDKDGTTFPGRVVMLSGGAKIIKRQFFFDGFDEADLEAVQESQLYENRKKVIEEILQSGDRRLVVQGDPDRVSELFQIDRMPVDVEGRRYRINTTELRPPGGGVFELEERGPDDDVWGREDGGIGYSLISLREANESRAAFGLPPLRVNPKTGEVFPVQRVQPDEIRGGTARAAEEILLDLSQVVGVNIGYKGLGAGATIGAYWKGEARMRLKYESDMSTACHELGHFLDEKYGFVAMWNQANIQIGLGRFDHELLDSEYGESVYGFSSFGTPSKNNQERRAEATAEWIRAWVINPEAAAKAAPEFYAHFIATVPQEVRDVLQEFGVQVRETVGASATERMLVRVKWEPKKSSDYRENVRRIRHGDFGFGPWARILLNNADTQNPFVRTMRDWAGSIIPWQNWLRAWSDSLQPIKAAWRFMQSETARQGREFDSSPSKDAVLMARLFSGRHGVMEEIFKNGMIDVEGNPAEGVEGGIEWITAPLTEPGRDEERLDREIKEAMVLAIAQRVLEKGRQLGRTVGLIGADMGFDESDVSIAIRTLKELGVLDQDGNEIPTHRQSAKTKRLLETGRRYRAWANATLRYAVDSGILSEKKYREIMDSNQFYVAMNREISDEPGHEVVSYLRNFSQGGGMGSVASDIKRFKGSSKRSEHPMILLMENTTRIVKEGMANKVKLAFVEPLREGGGKLATVGIKANADTPGNLLVVHRNGSKEHWLLHGDIFKAFKGWSENQMWAGNFGRIIRAFPNALRFGITQVLPGFAIRNSVRDVQHRLTVTRHGNLGSTDNAWDLFNLPKMWRAMDPSDLRRYGGDHAGFYARNRADYKRALDAAVFRAGGRQGFWVNPMRVIEAGWRGYQSILATGERVNRVAEFNAAKKYAQEKLGYDEYEASLYAAGQARDLMDFAVAGEVMRVINSMIPFSNAAVQGLKRNLKAMGESPQARNAFAVRFFLYAVIPSLFFRGLAEMFGYDDDLEQLPDYKQDLAWSVKLSDDEWLHIPRNFEIGVLAAFADRSWMYFAAKQEGLSDEAARERAWGGYAGSFFRTVFPFDETAFIPVFQPLAEVVMNKDNFRNKAIVPPWQEKVNLGALDGNGERIRDPQHASRLGKAWQWMFEAFGVGNTWPGRTFGDARVFDHLLSGTLGTAGTTLQQVSNTGRDDTNNTFNLKKQTGLMGTTPAYTARSVQEVYELAGQNGVSMQKVEFRRFRAAQDAYFNAESPAERQQRAEEWWEAADATLVWLKAEVARRERLAASVKD